MEQDIEPDQKERKTPCPPLTKKKVLRAIPGTMGIKARIARNLNCDWTTLHYRLQEPDWADVRKAIEEEKMAMHDNAIHRLQEHIDQKQELGTSLAAIRFFMSCQHGWREGSNVKIEGGDSPIKIEGKLTLEELESLPLDVKLQIQAAVEEVMKKKGEKK